MTMKLTSAQRAFMFEFKDRRTDYISLWNPAAATPTALRSKGLIRICGAKTEFAGAELTAAGRAYVKTIRNR